MMAATDLDLPTALRIRQKLESKWFAVAAMAGITVVPIEADNGKRVYVVSRWALTKQIDSLDDLASWLERTTGRRP